MIKLAMTLWHALVDEWWWESETTLPSTKVTSSKKRHGMGKLLF
jgi:hypothetical protein